MKRKYYIAHQGFVVLRAQPEPKTTNQKIKAWLRRLMVEVNRD